MGGAVSVAGKIESRIAQWLSARDHELRGALCVLESPIEQLFLAECLNCDWKHGFYQSDQEWSRVVWSSPGVDQNIGHLMLLTLEQRFGSDPCDRAVAQLPVTLGGRRFRIDFAFFISGQRIAVELDGHDFHERTKEQARAEKSRQRALTAAGWHVLRFTGSEVYADPYRCLMEVEDLPRTIWEQGRKS
jgi:hypothetical protein